MIDGIEPQIQITSPPLIARASVGCCTTQAYTYILISSAKTSVSLGVLVPLWLTIFYHGGTKTPRDTKNFVQNVLQQPWALASGLEVSYRGTNTFTGKVHFASRSGYPGFHSMEWAVHNLLAKAACRRCMWR